MRIFIACAEERLRIALLLLLDNEPGMAVVGMSDRVQGLCAQVEASQPHVLVMQWDLPARALADLLAEIRSLNWTPKVIYLSGRAHDRKRVLAAGADYYVVTNAPPDELLSILNDLRTLEAQG